MIVWSKDAVPPVRVPTEARLSALKRIIPRKMIQDVLRQTGRGRSYRRRLPACFVVWFVIGLGLFCRDSYRQVFRWLRRYTPGGTPGRSTLCEARKSLGVAPLRLLARKVVRLLGDPETPGCFYRGFRLMALDSFLLDVPDTPANDRAFGRPKNGCSAGAFPQVRVAALCETGTHVFWRFLIKPLRRGEIPMARYLLRFLKLGMLLLWDRNFFSYDTIATVRRGGAHLLARVKNGLIFQPIQHLSDGSYSAKVYPSARARKRCGVAIGDTILVRIIEYTFDDPHRPGSGERHRLLTTLLDPELDPAATLIVLYHERWEQEISIDEVKTHQRERPVLRSQTPAGVIQEIESLLLGHHVLRVLMYEAAKLSGVHPQRISFVATLKILRCRLPGCPATRQAIHRWFRALIAEISEEVLPPRRNRINPRVLKKTRTDWKPKRAIHRRYPQPCKEFAASVVMLN